MSKNPSYSFYFHYNKPASLKAGSVKLSVHYRGTCYIVSEIDCEVATKTKIRKTQPRCVVSGKAKTLTIEKDIAILR